MGAIDPPARDSTALILPLILVVDRKAQKLPLHRIDLGEVGRDEMIAAALAHHHLEATAHEGPGGSPPQRWMNAARSCFSCGLAVMSGA